MGYLEEATTGDSEGTKDKNSGEERQSETEIKDSSGEEKQTEMKVNSGETEMITELKDNSGDEKQGEMRDNGDKTEIMITQMKANSDEERQGEMRGNRNETEIITEMKDNSSKKRQSKHIGLAILPHIPPQSTSPNPRIMSAVECGSSSQFHNQTSSDLYPSRQSMSSSQSSEGDTPISNHCCIERGHSISNQCGEEGGPISIQYIERGNPISNHCGEGGGPVERGDLNEREVPISNPIIERGSRISNQYSERGGPISNQSTESRGPNANQYSQKGGPIASHSGEKGGPITIQSSLRGCPITNQYSEEGGPDGRGGPDERGGPISSDSSQRGGLILISKSASNPVSEGQGERASYHGPAKSRRSSGRTKEELCLLADSIYLHVSPGLSPPLYGLSPAGYLAVKGYLASKGYIGSPQGTRIVLFGATEHPFLPDYLTAKKHLASAGYTVTLQGCLDVSPIGSLSRPGVTGCLATTGYLASQGYIVSPKGSLSEYLLSWGHLVPPKHLAVPEYLASQGHLASSSSPGYFISPNETPPGSLETCLGSQGCLVSSPENLASNSENITSNSENVTSDLENVTSDLENVTSDLENVTSDLENVTSDLENVTSDLENVTSDSDNFFNLNNHNSPPENLASNPEKNTSKPENLASNPYKFSSHPGNRTSFSATSSGYVAASPPRHPCSPAPQAPVTPIEEAGRALPVTSRTPTSAPVKDRGIGVGMGRLRMVGLMMMMMMLFASPISAGFDRGGPQHSITWGRGNSPSSAVFGNPPSNVTAVKGHRARLPCHVKNLGRKDVSWIRQRDLHILTVGIFTYTTDDRFKVHHTPESEDWFLDISTVTLRDSGVYECQVSTSPKASLPITLNVLGQQKAMIRGPSEVYVQKGSTISLECEVRAGVEAVGAVRWFQGHNPLNYSSPRGGISMELEKTPSLTTSRLHITRAAGADSGNYTCHPKLAHPASVTVHVVSAGEESAAAVQSVCVGARACWTLVWACVGAVWVALLFTTTHHHHHHPTPRSPS